MAPRKKKIAAIVKVQPNAGRRHALPVGTALGRMALNITGPCAERVQRRDGERAWQRHPGGDHDLRRQVPHLHHEYLPAPS